MEGRAATITRSPFWSPVVILSRVRNPEGTPVRPPSLFWSFSMFSKASQRRSLIQTKPPRSWLSATWKTRDSASSTSSSTLRSPGA